DDVSEGRAARNGKTEAVAHTDAEIVAQGIARPCDDLHDPRAVAPAGNRDAQRRRRERPVSVADGGRGMELPAGRAEAWRAPVRHDVGGDEARERDGIEARRENAVASAVIAVLSAAVVEELDVPFDRIEIVLPRRIAEDEL